MIRALLQVIFTDSHQMRIPFKEGSWHKTLSYDFVLY